MLRKSLYFILVLALFSQCRKDRSSDGDVNSDPSIKLSFSDQVVLFDTVFTTIGSTTRWLKVYNTSDRAIEISSITLRGPNNAVFRMNVDGEAGTSIKNVFLAGKDSLFIFVDVTIDPNAVDPLPFIVEGSIEFVTNGNTQEVALVAYGQQAYFITPNRFPEGIPAYRVIMKGENKDTTWTNALPIVIYGYAVIDSTQHLTIERGTQIYFHANSGLWVYRYGQIDVKGTMDEPVVFQGDRLDDYKDISGSWDRIWINDGAPGQDNTFEYALIKNSFIGIQAEYNPFKGLKDGISQNQLNLFNTTIENSKYAGIYALNSKILGQNLLVNNSGNSNLLAKGGGSYLFQHATFANYYRQGVRNTPSVFLSQVYIDFEGQQYIEDSMIITFQNSIIYGDIESEFNIEQDFEPGKKINFTFDHVLFKSNIDENKYGNYLNGDTIRLEGYKSIFVDPYSSDFHLLPSSRAVDFGDPGIVNSIPLLQTDLEGNARSDGKPDLGVFEN
jgi:hypothetical protein